MANRSGTAVGSGAVLYRCANCGGDDCRSGADYQRRMNKYGRVWCLACLHWLGLLTRIDEDAGREHLFLARRLHSFSK